MTTLEVIDTKTNPQNHFVLVHGACHGAWCWCKLKPLLESAGHRVTAVDLSACGVNLRSLGEIHTLDDYADPLMKLMAAIPVAEKVVLVGHSFGGYSLALAMENYPHKIAVAVFLCAVMPDVNHSPQYFVEQDLELAKLLVRPTPQLKDLSTIKFSNEGYGSVRRAYIICPEDKAVNAGFQQWTVENFAPDEVRVIVDADHMAMLSKPKELCRFLLEIAD